MAICGCGSPAHCCQPAVAGGIIYADLRSELNTHLALQALFTQSSPVRKTATAISFPLSKHTGGGDTAPAFSGLHVYLQLTWDVGLPHSPVEFFLLPPLLQAFLLLVAGHVPPLLPSLASLLWGISTSPLFGTQGAPPSLLCVFFVVIAYYSVFFSFFPGWVSVCPGGYADLAQGCLWEYRIPLSSPCGPRLPKPSGYCCLAAAREPPWFLHLTWSGDAMCRLEVWRSKCFASQWFFL
jgi:hypothetical protein